MENDFLKKLLNEIPPEVREQVFKEQLKDDMDARGGLDVRATAVATMAVQIVQQLSAAQRSFQHVCRETGMDLPHGDAVMISALFAAGMAYAEGFMHMEPAVKAPPEAVRLSKIVTLLQADQTAKQVYQNVREVLENMEKLKVGSFAPVSKTAVVARVKPLDEEDKS